MTQNQTLRSLSVLMLLGAGLVHSAQAVEMTKPTNREDLFVLQQVFAGANMQESQGNAPASGDFEEVQQAPSTRPLLDAGLRDLMQEGGEGAEVKYGTGGSHTGEPPPSSSGRSHLLRSLDLGLVQSRNKTYEAGWKILHRVVKDSTSKYGNSEPPAIRKALDLARSASYEKSYKEAWQILSTAVKTVVDSPEQFRGPPNETFPAMLRLGRLCAYDKTYETGWKILNTFTKGIQETPAMIPDQLHRLTLGWNRSAAFEKSYKHAWMVLSQGVQRLERGVPNAGHVFEVALEASKGLTYEDGWKALNTFTKGLSEHRDQFPNAITYTFLKATRSASFEKSYKVAYQIQAHGADRLRQAVNSPQEYFQASLNASRDKTYEDAWDLLRDYAKAALESDFLDSFQRDTLNSSLKASYNQSYRTAYEVMRDGIRALTH